MALHFTWPLSQQIPQELHTHTACTPVCSAWYLLSLQREMQKTAFLYSPFRNIQKSVFTIKGSLAENKHPQNIAQKELEADIARQF